MMKLNTKKIASELKRLGWNQKRFAAEMGVTRQSIHYYMNRDGGNSFGTIEKIAKVLKINPRDLIK